MTHLVRKLLAGEMQKPRNVFDKVAGRFQPHSLLGEGGVCRVDEATDLRTGKRVALKRLLDSTLESRNGMTLMANEAYALSLIKHPGVPSYRTSSMEGHDPYIAMELIEGLSFAPRRQSDFSRLSILQTAISICDVLAAIHEIGIVHRDIKPANILLRSSHAPVIIDFGFAKIPGIPDYAELVNLFIGSPTCVAPEQTYPKAKVDKRADIYSMGIILYSYISRNYPYPPASNLQSMLDNHRYAQAPMLHETDMTIPRRLSLVVAKAMAKDPEKRLSDARELAEELSDCLDLFNYVM